MNPWLTFGVGLGLAIGIGAICWLFDRATRRRLDRWAGLDTQPLTEAEETQRWLDQQW